MALERQTLQKKIAAKISRFDPIALLRLLYSMGYSPEQIRFASHFSTTAQGSLIHAIEFVEEPEPLARITINLGLLSAQSPLPSYFFKRLDDSNLDNQAFVDFIHFFDHLLVSNLLLHIYPELNAQLFPDWELSKRCYLHLCNLKAFSTVHWLFRQIYPELGLRVQKAMLRQDIQTLPITMGQEKLGGVGVLGGRLRLPINGYRVTLLASGENTSDGRWWPNEVRRRLRESLFPIFSAVGLHLEVVLVIESSNAQARLGPRSFLGFVKLKPRNQGAQRITLFNGRIDAAKLADHSKVSATEDRNEPRRFAR
jgi:hypothetical protein